MVQQGAFAFASPKVGCLATGIHSPYIRYCRLFTHQYDILLAVTVPKGPVILLIRLLLYRGSTVL